MDSIAKGGCRSGSAVALRDHQRARSDGADFNVVVKRRDCVLKRTLGLRDSSLRFSGWTNKVLTFPFARPAGTGWRSSRTAKIFSTRSARLSFAHWQVQ